MTTILFVFLIALALSLVLTPLVGKLGIRFGSMDIPLERSIHTTPLPRCGGLAIATAFIITLACSQFFMTQVSEKLTLSTKTIAYLIGAAIVFGVGFFDDFRRLSPKIKFLFQLIAASIAFYGDVRIEGFVIGNVSFQFGIFSYVVTVFWFLLIINAMNLIDGLDGLAAGITFFASAFMVFLSLIKGDYLTAMLFAALGGAVLGFLRYNFNPASIFMGDGGSYFIGYSIASLSIFASIKSQLSAILMIPLLALGVPIFDTILSPVRRFLLGKRMFRPDKDHVHHRLLSMGFTKKYAVAIIYGISLILCATAIIIVNIRNDVAGLLLIILAASSVIIMLKLGYMEYLTIDKIYGWLVDVVDVSGLSQKRRSFLNLQLEIDRSANEEELWDNICRAIEVLRFDRAEWLSNAENHHDTAGTTNYSGIDKRTAKSENPGSNTQIFLHTSQDGNRARRIWTRGHYRREEDVRQHYLLKIELPLSDCKSEIVETLLLIKDIKREPLSAYTLRRVEHLRRAIASSLNKIKDK